MYNQQTNKIKPPPLDDDVDSFMQQRAKAPAVPKAAPVDDVDDFMSKRSGTAPAPTPARAVRPKKTPQPAAQPAPFSTSAFKPSVSMDFRAPTEGQKMANRALAPAAQPAPMARPKNAFQTPQVRKTQIERIQDRQVIESQQPQTVETDPAKLDLMRRETQERMTQRRQLARQGFEQLNPMQRLATRAMAGIGGATAADMQDVTGPVGIEEDISRIAQSGAKGVGSQIRGAATALPYAFPVVDLMSKGLTGKPLRNYVEPIGRMAESAISRGAETLIPENPNDQSFKAKLERGAGSLIPSVGGALATGGGTLAAGALGAMTNLGQVASERDKAGVPVSEARRVSGDALAVATGMTEALGIGRLLGRVGMKAPLVNRVARALEEGGQEYAQDYLNDINAKLVAAYDPQRQINDPLGAKRLEAAAIGAILGTAGEVADVAAGQMQSTPIPQQLASRTLANQNAAIRAEQPAPMNLRPAMSGPTQITPLTQTARATQPATPTSAIDPTVTAKNTFDTTEPLTEPLAAPLEAAESQPSALPRLPARELTEQDRFAQAYGAKPPAENRINKMIESGEALLNSPRENDRRQAENILKRSLAQIQKSEAYQNELGLPEGAPKPYTAVVDAIEGRLRPTQEKVRPSTTTPLESPQPMTAASTAVPSQTATGALRAEADAAKIKAAEFEQAGDFTQAAQTYEATHRNLKLLRRKLGVPKTPEDVSHINQIDREVSIAATNMQKAKVQARQMAKQANAPTAELAKPATFSQPKTPQPQAQQADTRNISAPLLRPEAVQPESLVIPKPSAPIEQEAAPDDTLSGRLNAGIEKQRAKKPPKPAKRLITRIAELGGISAQNYKGELQNLKDARRVGILRNKPVSSPDIIARQLAEDGYDVDPDNLDTLWAAIDRDVSGQERVMNTGEIGRRLEAEEAEYNAQQEELSPNFDQIVEDVDRELPEVTAQREREKLPTVQRREALRQAVPKGQYGKISEAAYKNRPNALVEHPQLRRLLGLKEMPVYRLPDAAINPKTGEPYVNPEWTAEAQNTLNMMAKMAGKERSSQISFDEGELHGETGQPTRSEMGELFAAVSRVARQEGEKIDPTLRMAFETAVTRARTAQAGWQEFSVDERTENIRQSLYERIRNGELNRKQEAALRTSFKSIAEEYSLSDNQADRLFSQTRNEARSRAERTGNKPQPGAAAKSVVAKRGKRVSGSRASGEQAKAETGPIKTGDSVTWQRGDVTESGKVTKVNGQYVTAATADGQTITRDASKFTKAEAQPKMREQKAPGFFSQLQRVIDAKMPAKASAAQVRAIIENPQSGVKPDEVKWTGLDDYLRGKDTVTKAEVTEFLKANQVEVREVTKGGPQSDLSPAQIDRINELSDRTFRGVLTPEESTEYGNLLYEQDATAPMPTKYGKFTLPGAKEGSYRELLLTLPEKRVPRLALKPEGDGWLIEGGGKGWAMDKTAKGDYLASMGIHGTKRYATLEEARRDIETMPSEKDNYKSSHFDEPNILAHIRFNERTDSEGRRVLHIEEIQSDWGQDLRKQRNKITQYIDNNFEQLVRRMEQSKELRIEC